MTPKQIRVGMILETDETNETEDDLKERLEGLLYDLDDYTLSMLVVKEVD